MTINEAGVIQWFEEQQDKNMLYCAAKSSFVLLDFLALMGALGRKFSSQGQTNSSGKTERRVATRGTDNRDYSSIAHYLNTNLTAAT